MRNSNGESYVSSRGKEDVTKAMQDKLRSLRHEVRFYEAGLAKIARLEEGKFYEVCYRETKFVGRLMKLGRDRALFRTIALESDSTGLRFTCEQCMFWGWEWSYKEISMSDLPLYVAWPFKTEWYNKYLKKVA